MALDNNYPLSQLHALMPLKGLDALPSILILNLVQESGSGNGITCPIVLRRISLLEINVKQCKGFI